MNIKDASETSERDGSSFNFVLKKKQMATEVLSTDNVHEQRERSNDLQCGNTGKPNPWTPIQLAKTIFLFSKSDAITFVAPATLFGVSGALSGSLLTSPNAPSLLKIIVRLPTVILWIWSTLIIFDFANQRSLESVAEDIINKPNRPIPAGRITSDQTRRLLLGSIPLFLLLAKYLGAWEESALLFVMTWVYNDLSGGNESWLIRNGILALAYLHFNKGALRTAAAETGKLSDNAWQWLIMTSGVIATTMHYQDIKDQDGDRARGRETASLVLGDSVARWTLAVPTSIWSVACPAYWENGLIGYAGCGGLGAVLFYRILMMKNVRDDKRTWWTWTAWTSLIWIQPVINDVVMSIRSHV